MWIYEPTAEDLARTKRCKCGSVIFFARTKADKLAPINSLFYKVIDRQKVGNIELVCIPVDASHFATCNYKEQFRRR